MFSFVDAARAAGVRRLLVDGSFVTSKSAPNDVDIVILPDANHPRNIAKLEDDELLWPFLQIFVAADESDFDAWATTQFGTDRQGRTKNVVEVMLWPNT